ncbi:MAG: hypothetical protein B6245_09455 [Desulfobacteraceae bacterium 4572_88]|nr:MAG: hypothetical protein B6245_09455 [Desulfobacteraceae bacterium 4572_88]
MYRKNISYQIFSFFTQETGDPADRLLLEKIPGGPAQVVMNSIYFLIFIHIINSVALNGKIMLFF